MELEIVNNKEQKRFEASFGVASRYVAVKNMAPALCKLKAYFLLRRSLETTPNVFLLKAII